MLADRTQPSLRLLSNHLDVLRRRERPQLRLPPVPGLSDNTDTRELRTARPHGPRVWPLSYERVELDVRERRVVAKRVVDRPLRRRKALDYLGVIVLVHDPPSQGAAEAGPRPRSLLCAVAGIQLGERDARVRRDPLRPGLDRPLGRLAQLR